MLLKIVRWLLIFGVAACTLMVCINVFTEPIIDWSTIIFSIGISLAGLYYYERVLLPEVAKKEQQIAEAEALEKAQKSKKKRSRPKAKKAEGASQAEDTPPTPEEK